VRLSGPASLQIAAEIFQPASRAPLDAPNRAHFGRLLDTATGAVIDQVILTYFRAPNSYTGEDIVELSCHGSPVILGRVLELVSGSRARIAEPGEFTYRAFANRRIDLAQAQAVRDVIHAQTEYQARVATRQLEGALSKRLAPIKESLVEIIVHLESSVEFVEEDISPETVSELLAKLTRIIESLARISASFSFGRYVREGFDLAIVGRPNVGKSSVFNRLVGIDRAIVTALPGTTRDALYESTSVSGVPVRLIDTAGIRETSDVVESIGIARSRAAIAAADISLLVLDASEPLAADDARLLEQVPGQRRIIALNKSDLPRKLELESLDAGPLEAGPIEAGLIEGAAGSLRRQDEVVAISAMTGEGFDRLTGEIFLRLGGDRASERDDLMITDARQHAAVQRAIEQLSDARGLMVEGELEEIILLKLHGALYALGEITGETLTDDILGRIFSTFCVGK
jgi:tRNA modification GTPase